MLRLDRVRLAQRTMVTWSKGYPTATGRAFADVMAELGLDDTATLERLAPAGAIYFLMSPDAVPRIFRPPLTMFGSYRFPFDPHPPPPQWAPFTNFLPPLLREPNLLPLAEPLPQIPHL